MLLTCPAVCACRPRSGSPSALVSNVDVGVQYSDSPGGARPAYVSAFLQRLMHLSSVR